MAFSFTPGQIAPQGSQSQAGPGGISASSIVASVSGPQSDSPFLILRERGQPLSVMACIQIVLVVVTVMMIFVSISLFLYSLYLKSSIDAKNKDMTLAEGTLKDYPFQDMSELSSRFTALEGLLKTYISPRSPLKFLENVVENDVVIDDFSLSQSVLSGTGYQIDFTVITNNYSVLIQQLAALNLKEYSKVAPKPKSGTLASSNILKLKVTTPIMVQGTLPDDIVFVSTDTSTATSILPLTTATSSLKTGSSTP